MHPTTLTRQRQEMLDERPVGSITLVSTLTVLERAAGTGHQAAVTRALVVSAIVVRQNGRSSVSAVSISREDRPSSVAV